MHDYNNNGISDKEDLIIMETDEENMCNGANTAIPAIQMQGFEVKSETVTPL